MSTKKTSELRQLTEEELEAEDDKAQEELFHLRFQQHTAQLSNTAQLREKRRQLARILTVKGERERAGGEVR